MIDYNQAVQRILALSTRGPVRHRTLSEAAGLALAEDIRSDVDLPPFDNAAMDGFALSAKGTVLRAGSEFEVSGRQVAGDDQTRAGPGAWEITTGAAVPAGFDTVVPVEQVSVLARTAAGDPARIRLDRDIDAGRHVRRHGEDVATGDVVLKAGARVAAAELAMLASLGAARLALVQPPRVALIATGRELVDDPAQPLASGQIRNSNGPFLAARVQVAGAEVVLQRTVGDTVDEYLAAVEAARARGAELILSTGAVSMGRHDFVPQALQELAATVHFHKVAIRPGKPLLFASLPDGVLCFGLPGNPVSSAVGLRFFVEPAIRARLGLATERPLRLPLAADYDKRTDFRCFLKGRVTLDADGRARAEVLDGQESFRIRPLLATTAWVVLDETAGPVRAGSLVDVHGLGHWQPPAIGSGE
ncbi:MAG TPA: gephyrin-like molybdotransferase Glp [Rhodanobacteraceae bacterium]|nr:gephyrin-like molybdotransferase Glp [Rhodanobacteraceae bacterium]